MAKSEKVALQKGKAFFNLIGTAKITDYTYKLNEVSEKTGWKYSRFNLGVETTPGNTVYAEAMGGFSTRNDNVVYVNAKEDFSNRYTIDWDDRFNEKVLETIHDNCFIKIGIEKYLDKEGKEKTYTKRFLSWYDAIQYLKEHLESGMVLNVKGDLKYSTYNDKIQIKKEIKSIFLSQKEPKDFRASFVQTVLLDKDSIGRLDNETNEYPIIARVIDYTKMYNDKEVKQNVPYLLNYFMKVNEENPELTKKVIDKFFKVRKNITEIAVEGEFVEGTQVGEVTESDIPDDMKELIELGLYTKDEVMGKLAVYGERVSKMYVSKPYIQKVKEGEKDILKTFVVPEKYKPEDLILDFMYADEKDSEEEPESEDGSSQDDWLSELV